MACFVIECYCRNDSVETVWFQRVVVSSGRLWLVVVGRVVVFFRSCVICTLIV
jgi:hypothetical protein